MTTSKVELDLLKVAFEAARETFRLNRTLANMDAVTAAWDAFEAASPKRQAWGRGSKVGRRAAAERNHR
jgi:hypothetical protein